MLLVISVSGKTTENYISCPECEPAFNPPSVGRKLIVNLWNIFVTNPYFKLKPLVDVKRFQQREQPHSH